MTIAQFEAEVHLPDLRREDLALILPKALAALQTGWRNICFVEYPIETLAELTMTAECGPLVHRYSMRLHHGMTVADGAVSLLDELAQTPPYADHWTWPGPGPEPGGLTMEHFWRARETLERGPFCEICCGQPMVECDFGNALKCETCQRILRRQGIWRDGFNLTSPEAALADGLPQDGDPGLEDRVQTLLDLARAGREADFKFLAGSVGVLLGDLEALWTGTVARLRSEKGAVP